MIDNIYPAVIFAVLAIIFAILNFLLWMMVWKKTGSSKAGENGGSVNVPVLDELKERIDGGMERNLRLEDQMWGVLDKLKEQEKVFNQFKDNIAAINVPERNKEVLDSLEMWSIKTLKTIKECFEEIKNSGKNFEQFEKLDILNNSIEDLSSNVDKLKNHLLNKE
jgi:hypothetical protein